MVGVDRTLLGAGVWLLWVGIGLNASLASMGYPWIYGQSLQMIFFAAWGVFNIDISQVVRRSLYAVVEVFFKDFDVAGAAQVPDGPAILACAPHSNQFLDGFCVMKAVGAREISFLTAAVTLRRKWVGWMARQFNGIAVERPQDLAKPGSGQISLVPGSTTLNGTGTQFTKEGLLTKKAIITVTEGPFKGAAAKVVEIMSDTELTLDKPLADSKDAAGQIVSFKVTPHLNQSTVFSDVYERLRNGGAVGIFPEGGSHDRTQLLPLKAGVSIMALGAMASQEGLKVPIIPVGINYFKGHRFRSRVFIDIGSPIFPTDKQLAMFKEGKEQKRKACAELLESVVQGIGAVTLEAPDFKTLQFFRAMRRLYWSKSRRMTAEERFKLTSAFAKGYEKVKDEPQVKELRTKVQKYRSMLKTYAISDYRVTKADTLGSDFSSLLGKNALILLAAYRVLLLALYMTVAVPGILAALPFFMITRPISAHKARVAAKRSKVKIAGRDLIATWKVLVSLVLVPLLHAIYTSMLYLFVGSSASIVYFFFMPFVSMIAIRSTEMSYKLWAGLKPLIYSISKQDAGLQLVATRRATKEEVLKVVKAFKWDSSLIEHKETAHLYRTAPHEAN